MDMTLTLNDIHRGRNFMKKTAFIAVILTLVICFSVSTYAASNICYNDYAVKLSEIGVFKGTGSGFELDREPTRLEGLIMLVRLLGKETEANQLSKQPCVFNDVPDWGRGYVNYAYKNGLTKGVSSDKFGTLDKMNGKSYMTFLLRSLGYDDSVNVKDFTWANSVEYAKSIGLLENDLYSKIINSTFIRDYIAKSSYNTLKQPLKGSTTSLIQKLVSSGVITQTQADSLNSVNNSTSTILSSIEIGKLADAAVLISAVGYDGSEWTGSGFYTTQDGNLVTNYHVVDGAKTLEITENNGQVYTGAIKVIGYDAEKDIAVLDIDKTVKLYLRTGNSDSVVLGEEIYTIGSPYGLKNTISNGIISSLREDDILQISAPISHGSSGGVLLNNNGLAIGITFAIVEGGENLGFAVPINQYINMPKNLNLDLAAFYNQPTSVPKPTNVKLNQIKSDSVTIYWDKVSSAEYYRVYITDSVNGTYYALENENGSDEWPWMEGYCLSTSELETGSTYYIKVTAVIGNKESRPSDVKAITLAENLSYDEYEASLLNTYKSLNLNGYQTYFDEISIDTSEDTVAAFFYLDNSYINPFIDMMKYDKSIIESKVAEIASEISVYFNDDITVSIVYFDTYNSCPTGFEDNKIYSKTVSYDDEVNKWYVYYPYLNVELYNSDNTYYAEWAY